jgi:paraquat-inducible protein B
MSFDTELDYSPVIAGFNERIATLQLQLADATAELNTLNSSPYTSYVENEIIELGVRIDSINASIAGYTAVIAEMNRIQLLSAEEKNLIYYFYSVLGIRKDIYLTKLLFNTDKVFDSRVQTVYNDTTTDNATKLLVAQKLYSQFSVSTLYKEVFEAGSFVAQ